MFDFRAKLQEFRLMTVTGVTVDLEDSTKEVNYLYINKDNLKVKVNTREVCKDLNFEFYSLNEENEYNKEDIPEEEYTKGVGVNVMDLVDIHEQLATAHDSEGLITLEAVFDKARNGSLDIVYNPFDDVITFHINHWSAFATDNEVGLQTNTEIEYVLQSFKELSETTIFDLLLKNQGEESAFTVMPMSESGKIVYKFSLYDADAFNTINDIVNDYLI